MNNITTDVHVSDKQCVTPTETRNSEQMLYEGGAAQGGKPEGGGAQISALLQSTLYVG